MWIGRITIGAGVACVVVAGTFFATLGALEKHEERQLNRAAAALVSRTFNDLAARVKPADVRAAASCNCDHGEPPMNEAEIAINRQLGRTR